MRSELRNKLLFGASLFLLLAACPMAHAITIFRVAATSDREVYPSVSGNTVVWQFFNSRYGDWDIEAAQVFDGKVVGSFTIADLPGDDLFPIIDGNDVVWQHQYDETDGDVYGARIGNGHTLSRYAISASMDDERIPCVSDGVVVWQHGFVDAPDWDILGARLTGSDNPEAFFVSAMIDVDEVGPCISGNLAVWQQRSSDLPQPFVYGADISDPNSPRLFYTNMALGEQQVPSLSDGWLVGRETDKAGKVMVDNLFDPFNPEGISSSSLTACPRIHKHIVVWQDGSNGTGDIRGYNLITRQEFILTNTKMSDQVNPAVYVDTEAQRAIVVWQDDRDGNWDIYGAILDGPEVATTTEP
ncbi:MAG TPA: hypothetical protein PKH24_18140 [Sedimentisphaerales bacterium]|jgi:hypothetical protein|nr:hypothetical protein [Sedimentisphaerales bacterium]HNU28807.1 hypothetical protein [Sedimentisphaerales bacterium]